MLADDYVALLSTIFDVDSLRALFARKDFKFVYDAMHGGTPLALALLAAVATAVVSAAAAVAVVVVCVRVCMCMCWLTALARCLFAVCYAKLAILALTALICSRWPVCECCVL